ncbi:HNH endonuclease [bacterium]|nr:HNH endonuclease [bacterium]
MAWSEETIQKVWEKGKEAPPNDPNVYRKDQCDAWMKRDHYGNRQSQYGWEIDHISPGGTDELHNLRPLQWENNVDKSDGRLKCKVTANGENNIKQ